LAISLKKRKSASKEDIDGYLGGLSVDLKRECTDGKTVEKKLAHYTGELLAIEKLNHEPYIKKMKDRERRYLGKLPDKSYPHPNCANMSVPITQSAADTIFVRMYDALLGGEKKPWIFRATHPDTAGIDRELEDAIDHYQRYKMRFKEKIVDPLLQSVKTGSGVAMLRPRDDKRTVYRRATPEEIKDKNIKTYKTKDGVKVVKVVETSYTGPDIFPVPREDFIFNWDATSIQDADMVGFRMWKRKHELEKKARQGFYDSDKVNRLLVPDEYDDIKEFRAKMQDRDAEDSVTDNQGRFEVWELWLDFDVDDDGEEDAIVVTYNPATNTILRCIYNPMFKKFKPFILFGAYPREYSMDGIGVCETLEQIQKIADALQNQMIDRLTELNAPVAFLSRDSDLAAQLANKTLTPGRVYLTDSTDLENDIREFRFSDTTFSVKDEINQLMGMSHRAIGIAPENMGQTTANRPVFKEAAARLEEANRKFKFMIDIYRNRIAEAGYMMLEMFAQYQPTYTYRVSKGGEKPQIETRTVDFPFKLIRDGFDIQMEASSEVVNQDVRREMNMAIYSLLSDYMTKNAGMVQAILNPQMPEPMRKFLISSYQAGMKVIKRILQDFDIADVDSLVVGIDEVLQDMEQMRQAQPPMPPPGAQPPMQAEGAPVRVQ
jgi:hypothetical protein